MANVVEILITAKDEASGVFSKVGGVLSGAFKIGLGAAAAGLAGVGAGLGLAMSEALEAQTVAAQLNSVLESTGGAAGVTAEMASNLAGSLMDVTRFGDEAILSGENLLLTFTQIGKDIFPEATEIMLDMSQAMGQDIKSSAIQLGKALNDPIKGMSALSRVGVAFTEDQAKMITGMVEAGDVMGAQKVILAELQKEFGGSAKAAGETLPGQLDILKNQLLNVAEGVGTALIPVLQSLVNWIKPIVPIVQTLGNAFSALVETGDVEDFLDNIRDGFAGLVPESVIDTIENVVYWISDVLVPVVRDQVIPGLIEFASAVWEQLGPGLVQLGTWIQQLGEILLPILRDAIGFVIDHWQIFAGIAAVIGAIILAINAPIALVIGALVLLATAWANNWGGIQDKVTAVWNFIQPFIQNAIGFVQSVIQTVLTTINQWWSAHGESVITVVQGMWQFVSNAFNAAVEFIGNLISAAVEAWQSFWSAHGETIKTVFSNAWENIKTVIKVALDIIGGIFDAFSALFRGDFESFGEAIKGIWQSIWDGLKTILSNAIDSIKTVLGDLITSITKKFTEFDWKGLGDQIVQGLANGIASAAHWVIAAVQELGGAIISAIKKILGISSPSKIGTWAGQMWDLGIAGGMLSGIQPVRLAAEAVGMATIESAQRGFERTILQRNLSLNIYSNQQTTLAAGDFYILSAWAEG